jgi:hypothetical protein
VQVLWVHNACLSVCPCVHGSYVNLSSRIRLTLAILHQTDVQNKIFYHFGWLLGPFGLRPCKVIRGETPHFLQALVRFSIQVDRVPVLELCCVPELPVLLYSVQIISAV